jgi:hypothetical protein
MGQIVGYGEGNRYKLYPTDFANIFGQGGHEASRLARKNPLESLALLLVRPDIEVEAQGELCLSCPNVAVKLTDSKDIEAV